MPHAQLILIRHGESEANANNMFTGWSDPPLTAVGREQACLVGQRLREAKIRPARIFQSALGRCTETVTLILDALDAGPIAVTANAALNERDYGVLTGMDKTDAQERFGVAQVRQWRRSYAATPPEGESLRDTAARMLAYYVHVILPQVMVGGTTLIVSHGNALRALVMAIDGLDVMQIESFDLSTGATIVYDLGSTTAVVKRMILN